MIWNVFCPYGNAYPKHSLPSIGLPIVSTLLIMAFAVALYDLVQGNHNMSNRKKIAILILGVFTATTLVLNILLANW